MEKIIKFERAYDKRSSDPKRNYGIHGVTLRMVLKGDEGAVQFVLYTHWQLPHVSEELLHKSVGERDIRLFWMPMPADLGYHSPRPLYNGQTKMESCEYVPGGCFYDGSTLSAERVYERLLREGDEGVWKELKKLYNETFKTVAKFTEKIGESK